jgi:hypothetical protein
MAIQLALYGEDAEQFEAIREEIGERRRGNDPNRAETLRILMEEYDDSTKGGLR